MKVIFSLLMLCSLTFGQRLEFFKESLTFRLDGSYFNVEGYYWFCNNNDSSLRTEIYYPFPNGRNEKIDSIRVINVSKIKTVTFRAEGEMGISFWINAAPHDTLILQVGYRQKLLGDSSVYILRTTQEWDEPLTKAEYVLIVPETLLITNFSYEPDNSYSIDGNNIYYWVKENFMPEKDMKFYFRKE